MHGGRQPGPDHPITIAPATQRVSVRLGGATLADSAAVLILREANYPPVFYIPREDVAVETLVSTTTRTHCPFKGDASYFRAADGDARDIAWSYEDPFDAVAAIRGHLAFYPDRVDAIETSPISKDG